MQETARGFSLFEEALLVFQAQDLNVEPCTKIQCYRVIYDEKKRATTQTPLNHFFKRVDRIESSIRNRICAINMGVSETVACPLSPLLMILQLYHLTPPLSPPVSNPSSQEDSVTLACLLDASPCVPAVALCLLLFFARYCIKD